MPQEVPATMPPEPPIVAAPRREKRLVPAALKPTPVAPPTPRGGAASFVSVPVRPAKPLPAIERKIAALNDPEELFNALRTEAALRRAQRLSGAGSAQRQTMRILSVCMLFALLAAALGAMWYLQTSLEAGHRRRAPATPPPASTAQH